jgi:hypothetical protein
MPANLPPTYFAAEKRLRLATTPQEKISILKEMLAIMPHHKGTDKLQAELRAKIAKLNKEMQKRRGARVFTYHIKKEGVAQALLLGLPNSGKSTLLSLLTNSTPEIASYPFTTTTPVIGMLQFENIQIQLVELPALTHEFTKRWLSGLIWTTDLLMFIVDLSDLSKIELIIEKIETFSNKRIIVVGNKIDIHYSRKNLQELRKKIAPQIPIIGISCKQKNGIEKLKKMIYESLDVVRVYTKEPGKEADLTDPIVLPKGSTLLDAACEIHKDFANKLKYARVWGKSKYKGQRVARNYELRDQDIIEFHI